MARWLKEPEARISGTEAPATAIRGSVRPEAGPGPAQEEQVAARRGEICQCLSGPSLGYRCFPA